MVGAPFFIAHHEDAFFIFTAADDALPQYLYAVFHQLFVADLQEIGGEDIIPGEVVVHAMRPAVTVFTGIKQEHLAPASPQHNGSIEPCRTTADNDTILYFH